MIKKLIYSFYVSEETVGRKINDIHFKCLENYCSIFDEIVIVIINDQCSKETIKKIWNRFFDLPFMGELRFRFLKNGIFRESQVFENEVVNFLGEDKLVFFAHNKGITNVGRYDEETIYKWVAGMYYYSLNFIDEVEYSLLSRPYISYGSFLTSNKDDKPFVKYQWCYIGTFFWINSSKLFNYIKLNNVYTPQMSDRYYDELFLGNIYPMNLLATSHEDRYIKDAVDYYHHAEDYIHILYGEADDFYDFYRKITENL